MSTLVSYLLAAILQFIGASMPKEQATVTVLNPQRCEETASVLPYTIIINNEHKTQTSKEHS